MVTSPESNVMQDSGEHCVSWEEMLRNRQLVIASNHGPVTFHRDEEGNIQPQRSGGGGLVTALSGIAQYVDACWIASSLSEEDRGWKGGVVPIGEEGGSRPVFRLHPLQRGRLCDEVAEAGVQVA
jgi:hypothetical protein